MNNSQLNRLLKKKGWTGKEVGQLLFSSLFNDIKQLDKKDKKLLFTQSEFEKIESTISTDWDFTVYGVYRDLYSSIIDSFNRGQGLHQQFYNGFSRLLLELREIQNTEHAQKSIDNTPLIMTESQYKRLETEAIQADSENKESFCSLVFSCLDEFLKAEETQIKEAAPAIWEALEATKKIPATGNRFLPLYNETYGEGYYSLPDGRRSDQMTKQEWEKVLQEQEEEEYLKNYKLIINGEQATTEETITEYKRQRLIQCYELFFKGADYVREFVLDKTGSSIDHLTDEEIEEALITLIDGAGIIKPKTNTDQLEKALGYFTPTTVWHTYEEPPKDLTLYDLLYIYSENGLEVALDLVAKVSEKKAALQNFKKDFPDLYNALKAYIESKVPQARGLKANQLYKDIISWGELATFGVIGYEALIKPNDTKIIKMAKWDDTTENHSKVKRFCRNGIAIIKNPSSSQVDANGDYIEPKDPLLYFNTIYSLEEEEERITSIKGYVNNLINPAMSYFYSFNALMKIIGKVYDLPELAEVITLDTSLFESKISGYNGLLAVFYYDVYGNKEEKQHKRAVIKEVFDPLETDILKPSQEAIEEITEELTQLGYSSKARIKLKYLDAFLDRLMNSREGV